MAKKSKKNTPAPTPMALDAATLVFPPSIYLGPRSSASSTSFLAANDISHILSVGSSPPRQVPGIDYHRLSLTDSPSSSIARVSRAANEIIELALATPTASNEPNPVTQRRPGKILVHCSAGVSRSPTIIVAYLMQRHHMTLKEALGLVVRARPSVCPNPGFLSQLKEMEREAFGEVTLAENELPRRKEERLMMFATEV